MYDYNIKPFKFWCQKVLPLVYDDSLSYMELLCKVVNYLNHIIEDVNQIPELIQSLISDEKLEEIMNGLLDELREQIAQANEGTNTTASYDREKNELVWLNGKLAIMTRAILAGDKYVEEVDPNDDITGNFVYTTIEKQIKDVVNKLQPTIDDLYSKIGELDNLETETKSNLVDAINEVLISFTTTIGNLSDLETEDKTTIVNAINEILDTLNNAMDNLNYMPAIDVTKHGLIADGVTDNYTAFNTLYSQHKNLYFPKGNYYFSQPININRRGSIIYGEGIDTKLIFDTNGILISNYYCELHDLSLSTRGQNVYGIKLTSSYAKIHDIYMYDSDTTWFNNFIIGDVGVDVWFSFIENIVINDSSISTKNGTAFEFTSTVNNVLTNIIVTQKNKGFVFNADKTIGYSTDGCQLNVLNVTQCNYGIDINDCSAIYVSQSIFDQIIVRCIELVTAKNITFDECYLSAGNNSKATFKIGDIITSDVVRINNTQLSGTGASAYGITVQGTNELTITDCSIDHTTNAITFSDANSTNCYLHNISFDDLVQSKLYVQGYTNIYGLLKGTGTVTIAGGLQSATAFNQGTMYIADMGTNYYYDCDIALPTGMANPIGIFVVPVNSDAVVTASYLSASSPSGYARVRLRRVDEAAFNHENLTLSFIYAIA